MLARLAKTRVPCFAFGDSGGVNSCVGTHFEFMMVAVGFPWGDNVVMFLVGGFCSRYI
jgi:hypothetical protein